MLVIHHGDLSRLSLIFGLGMIGDEVRTALVRGHRTAGKELPFSWSDRSQQHADRLSIEANILAIHRQCASDKSAPAPLRINILWSAGKGGFEMTQEHLESELRSFESVAALAENLRRQLPVDVGFHLLSSAGALFEGQVAVDPDSQPSPQRPYGELKLRQERVLESMSPAIGKSIYRPSTVYGCSGPGKRVGLIARLVTDNINNKVTRIFGSLETMRDYVFVSDVARFVAREMLYGKSPAPAPYVLASGKPTTINEVIRIVERIMPSRTYMQFEHSDFNSRNNSFNRKILPAEWRATDLETGIRIMRSKILNPGNWP